MTWQRLEVEAPWEKVVSGHDPQPEEHQISQRVRKTQKEWWFFRTRTVTFGGDNYHQRDHNTHKRNRRKRKIQKCWGQRRNYQGQYPEPAKMPEIIFPSSLDIIPQNPHLDQHSKTIINLSEFKLEDRHRKLLEKGLSHSPTGWMNEFEVYKDYSYIKDLPKNKMGTL